MNAPQRQMALVVARVAKPRTERWSRRRGAAFIVGTALAFWGIMALVVHFAF
jgi:hypothetical protein